MRHRLKNLYLGGIDSLLKPFRKKGQEDPFHQVFRDFLSFVQAVDDPVVLELGSRNVSGVRLRNWFPSGCDYTGVDILEGEGVDVVADVHQLSKAFADGRFDFVHSMSVFEHLLFPWKAVLELNAVMKQGGYLYLSTHPVWPEHELPWDFWRFPKRSFMGLFNEYTGFEIIALDEGLPCKIFSLVDDLPTRRSFEHSANQGVALIAKKTGEYRRDLLRWDIEISDVVETMYPSRNE
ncbi:methyltransferase domain-containing protein [Pelagicoccus sp. SDUM812002]|uniref:class I SAM-dependent methyltransferase n=1 Tax=Pelagicoccus sp. SDUM812002 TaxID=3041266 RepID=UPI00280EF550|nr:methyltransferase domain-containing protein [Pelagicoccus sp. SDUM812002]MDQ8185915.1 methyltransferase domain-containing protein [Pelagicoccus sp. SDUM812002]